ncbi:MAG TPA: HAMP domain-containing sensor histidine kinase [Acetivibrio sp.]|uniref:sensor histidine kinase n=1 Tax=Acetivibrio sp. TaxID=1872092 RepID=UPI002B50BA1E|nr:HAMP domain-containing sensor histidine kinase [Acetivibrio sp.]HOM02137.1 HAMP domain-containing sensor histidine kinase [Acetivibrio sp.]
MDIKWKNIKRSNTTKGLAFFLAWLSFLVVCGSWGFLIKNEQIVTCDNYYSYPKYISNFSSHVASVVDYYIWLKDVRSEEDIIENEIDWYVITEKSVALYNATQTISNILNFGYYIKDTQTGEVITNVEDEDPIEFLRKQRTYVYINNRNVYNQYLYRANYIMERMKGTNYEVYAAVIEPLKPGDEFYDDYIRYTRVKSLMIFVIISLIVCFILLIGCLAYLFSGTWKGIWQEQKEESRPVPFIDKVYLDIHTIGSIILILICGFAFANTLETYYDNEPRSILFLAVTLSVAFITWLSYSLSLIRRRKRGNLSNSILFIIILRIFLRKIKDFIKQCFNGKIFRVWILILLPFYVAINCMLFVIFVDAYVNYYYSSAAKISGFLLVFINVLVFAFIARALRSLATIMEGTKQISQGNIDYEMNSDKMSPVFAAFAENICNIRGGLKNAVEEAIKGERMKTELITNVSHDLKTPLTSIINYVDLLKREEVGSDKAKEYIGILEEKSARLKVLIEDLVEASKASSGNLAVNLEKVDLHELILQAHGEYQEKMEKAGLDIRISAEEKNIFVLADGKHMWRIIENLMSNVLKYSLRGTRVYINISKNQSDGVLVVKNISAIPLNIPAERLTERFVRGDESRTTEGSGLGLSIAQSLTALQRGKFDIQIDGDLFKVTVEMPLWRDSK